MDELSEIQFKFIKALCANHMYLMIIPTLRDDDSNEAKELYNKNYQDIKNIIDLGFLEDATDKFENAQPEAIARTGRGFTAYTLTPLAIQMFDPSVKEGVVN